MAYDDEQATRSRVVVETPTSRREVTHTEAVHGDRGDREGVSGGTVGIIVVVAIALITIVVLFLMNGQNNDTTNANLALQQPPVQQQPVILQQPAQQQPPVIIQQPAAAPQQAPVIINQPAPSGGSSSSGSEDGSIQMAIDKRIGDDPTFSTMGITATVLDGKVTLTGSVKTEGLKTQLERMIRATKGVKQVDNQIVAMG